jgi:hypothetical protein
MEVENSKILIEVEGVGTFQSANDAIQAIAKATSRIALEEELSAFPIMTSRERFSACIAVVQEWVDNKKIKVVGADDKRGECGRTVQESIDRMTEQHEMIVTYFELPPVSRGAIDAMLGSRFYSKHIETDEDSHEITAEKFDAICHILEDERGYEFLQQMMNLDLPASDLDEVTRTLPFRDLEPFDEDASDEGVEALSSVGTDSGIAELTDNILIASKDRPLTEGLYDNRIHPEMLYMLHEAYKNEVERDDRQDLIVQSFMWIICAVQWEDWEKMEEQTKKALLDLHLIEILKDYWILNGTIEARDLFDVVGFLVSQEGGNGIIGEIRSGRRNTLRKVAEIAKRYSQLMQAGLLAGLYDLKMKNIASIVNTISVADLEEEDDLDVWKLALTDEVRTGSSYFEPDFL